MKLHPNFDEKLKLSPIVKWAGGKEQELKFIIPNLPKDGFENFYEPFVGGGSVFTALQAQNYFINDKSVELINLYQHIATGNQNDFYKILGQIIQDWNKLQSLTEKNSKFLNDLYISFRNDRLNESDLKEKFILFISKNQEEFDNFFAQKFLSEKFIKEFEKNFIRKFKRMKSIEITRIQLPDQDILENIETSFKSAYYMHIRHIYNHLSKLNLSKSFEAAIFLFIRNFAYSGMFRYNSSGEFNVPYGGIGYNQKNFRKKVDYFRSDSLLQKFQQTEIFNLDFEDFFIQAQPKSNDFIFLDPPYDSEFSTYAQNEFTREDQKRLATYLIKNCKARWMMIIKHTDFIYDLYANKGLNIQSFDKKYLVSFMNRNDKNVTHLMIRNY